MMRFSFLFFTFSLTFLLSCDTEPILLESNGAQDELVVFMSGADFPEYNDTGLVKSSMLYDSFLFHFNKAFIVTPTPEPMFDIKPRPIEKYVKLYDKRKLMLFLCDLSRESEMLNWVARDLGEDNLNLVREEGRAMIFEKEDVTAKPQKKIYLVAPTYRILVESLREKGPGLRTAISNFEFARLQRLIRQDNRDDLLQDSLRAKFGVNATIPSHYDLVKPIRDPGVLSKYRKYVNNFTWIRTDYRDIPQSLTFFAVPFENDLGIGFDNASAIKMRDLVGLKFIDSEIAEDTMVSTDDVIPFYHSNSTIDGMELIITRGIWEFKQDFKGGPFINYFIKDEQNRQYLSVDGFLYAPFHKVKVGLSGKQENFSKRKFVRILDATISLIQFSENN